MSSGEPLKIVIDAAEGHSELDVEQPSVGYPGGGSASGTGYPRNRPRRQNSSVLLLGSGEITFDNSGRYIPSSGTNWEDSRLKVALNTQGENPFVETFSSFSRNERPPDTSQGGDSLCAEPGPIDEDSQAPVSQPPQKPTDNSTKR
ncbi:uncharacterized protein L203_101708 [Cryptococcus depauperatus CBS 7841]|uniref:Uncharacterized protein n=1 Tax=Cryptococcus depauperatus CBS 7841 TaxID=1295531 RepID=A0A1E3HRU2_9TREE|nr:hypothetical protein L203_06241 [Cryptococcus depauperatus CBS 7841]